MIPAAVEESLRFEPPVLFLFRTAERDTELSGEKIPAGERIVLGIASGNRDESVYERAGEFWLERGWPHAPQAPHASAPARTSASATSSRAWRRAWCSRGDGALRAGRARAGRRLSSCTSVPMFLEYGPERLDVVAREGGA